jgi:hypothetical protein
LQDTTVKAGIVTGVTDGELSCVVSIAGPPAAIIIVLPFVRTGVVPYLTDIGATKAVLAGITTRHNTGVGTIGKPFGTIHIVEPVHNEYCVVVRQTSTHNRAGERESSVIAGHYIIVIPYTGS